MALDYFDASINRVSAWAVGFRSWQKALLSALCTPAEDLKKLQDETRSQQKAVVNTLKMLRSEQEKNPDNPELEKLVIATELDAQFLTRARIETFAHNQEINETKKYILSGGT